MPISLRNDTWKIDVLSSSSWRLTGSVHDQRTKGEWAIEEAISTSFVLVSLNGEILDYSQGIEGASWAMRLRKGANLREVWPGCPLPGENLGDVTLEFDGVHLQFSLFPRSPAAAKEGSPPAAAAFCLAIVELTPMIQLRERLVAAEKEADFFSGDM